MKKTLIVFLLIAFASTVSAGWPEGYQGEELENGCFEIVAHIDSYHDKNPWGMIDPSNTFFVLGDLCVEGGVANLLFERFAYIKCEESPWGVIGQDEVCTAKLGGVWPEGPRILPFENGSYIAGTFEQAKGDTVYRYEALTCEGDVCKFTDGVFLFTTPLWFDEDDRFTRAVWIVEPWTGEIIEPKRARARRK